MTTSTPPHNLVNAEDFASRIGSAVDLDNCIVAIDIVEGCSLRCPGCFTAKARSGVWGQGQPRLISAQMFRAALAFGGRLGSRRLSIIGGDPCLHPHLPLLIREATDCDFRVSVTTNGIVSRSRLDAILRSGLAGISFSLDGSTPLIHDRIRPSRSGVSTFTTTLESLKYAVSLSAHYDYVITVNHTIYPQNAHDVDNMVRLSSDAGADCVRLHFSLPGDFPEPDGVVSIIAPEVWRNVLDCIPVWRETLGVHVEAPAAYGLLDDPCAVRKSPYINLQMDGGILLCAAYTRLPAPSAQVTGWLTSDGDVTINPDFEWDDVKVCKGNCRVLKKILRSLPHDTQKKLWAAGGITCMIGSHMRKGKSWLGIEAESDEEGVFA